MRAKDHSNEREDHSVEQGNEAELHVEPTRDLFSSQQETNLTEENNKAKRVTRVPKKIKKKEISDINHSSLIARLSTPKFQLSKTSINSNQSTLKKSPKQLNVYNNSHVRRNSSGKKTKTETKEALDEAVEFETIDEGKEVVDVLDEAPNCDQSNSTDTETADREEEPIVPPQENINEIMYQKMELEEKLENFEDELREIAVIEFSMYSVAAEHASSGYEVHTPARRLSKVLTHACESFSQDKRAHMVRCIVSGLVHVAKSCSNDISRLTFWLSNTIVLREIITQNMGKSSHRSWLSKSSSMVKPDGKRTSIQPTNVLQESNTIVASLKKIEYWIFNQIVESVWWQALTPYMQSPMLGHALGDGKQGNFSVNLRTMAFHNAFTRLCPLRARGSKCGCLAALAKLVMESCIARLDIAMFNAILRESDGEVLTDPISDPITDPKLLPVPPRDLSFGTGAQLRNAIGNWSIALTETFCKGVEEYKNTDKHRLKDDDDRKGTNELMWFRQLQELSELLMLPKDMLLEATIRQEVCPTFSLSLIKRILSDFKPDELCPDPVPDFVMDELQSESVLDEPSDMEKVTSIPCAAPTIAYHLSSLGNMAIELATVGDANSKPDNKVLSAQMRGYHSQNDLRELELPLFVNEKGVTEMSQTSERYKLLQEIWYE